MNENPHTQADVWQRWVWLWDAIFYATAIVSFGLLLPGSDSGPVPHSVAGLLTAFMLLWHWGGMRLAYREPVQWEERALARLLILIGDAALWFTLVSISPVYYLALFGLFGQVFRQLPIRYAAPTILLLTIATMVEQLADPGQRIALSNPTLWLLLFMGLATIMLGIWVWAIIEQSTRRRELIEQLEATQAELASAERREGILQERQRLAREIHDTLAQGFAIIVINLEAAEQVLPHDLAKSQKHLSQARRVARDSLEQARRVVQDLRPDLLESGTLPDAIRRTASRWSEESAIPLSTTITGDPAPLHPNIEVTLLRAAQEALNNVRKHAQARSVQLTLSYMSDVVILDVQDDGVGVDGAEPSPLAGGFGLQAMRERAAQCGGTVTVESDPGEGTTVVVAIPLTP